MNSTRRIAVAARVFFLITEVTAIGGRLLYDPVLTPIEPQRRSESR
jgi:hypothetical protein